MAIICSPAAVLVIGVSYASGESGAGNAPDFPEAAEERRFVEYRMRRDSVENGPGDFSRAAELGTDHLSICCLF